MKIPKCNQCDSAWIQFIYCHETGCPNENKEWNPEEECWEIPDMGDPENMDMWQRYGEDY